MYMLLESSKMNSFGHSFNFKIHPHLCCQRAYSFPGVVGTNPQPLPTIRLAQKFDHSELNCTIPNLISFYFWVSPSYKGILCFAVGDPISAQEQSDAIFKGLPEEYDTIVTFIGNNFEPISIEDIDTLSLVQEAHITKCKVKNNVAQYTTSLNVTQSFSLWRREDKNDNNMYQVTIPSWIN